MTTVYLALGSNVGDPKQHIAQAIELLNTSVSEIRQAHIYRTKPVGHTDQADFLNTAISGQTQLSPEELLTFIKQAEQKLGRVERFRWGPREIDIDLIIYGNSVQEAPALTLPHPAFRERDFVLQPLKDLAPDLKDPVSGQTVSELLQAIPPSERSIVAQVD